MRSRKSLRFFRGVLVGLAVFSTQSLSAQTSRWVAYNDHNGGPATAPEVTTYTPQGPDTTVGGPLLDVATGNPVAVGMQVITAGDYNDFDGTSSAPEAGTPADLLFGGVVDWNSSALYFGDTPGTVTITFTNLTAGAMYSFRGTAVRGGNYVTRWTAATLEGALSAVPAHIEGPGSIGVVTNGYAPYGDTMEANVQVAWNAGHNLSGDVIGWDQIVPEGDSFSVVCVNWVEPTPGGAGNSTYSYAISAVRLEEFAAGAFVSITSPGEGQVFDAPVDVPITAAAGSTNGVDRVEFYANGSSLGSDSSSPYAFTWSGAAVGMNALTAVAVDTLGAQMTSSVVTITVNPPANLPPAVTLFSPVEGSQYLAPATVVLAADASDADGLVTRVEFFAGESKVGERTAAPFSFTWTDVPVGTYTLKAVATDNAGAATESEAVTIGVVGAGGNAWVAYNDHNHGPGTAANVSTFSISTALPAGGQLINFESGALVGPEPVGVEIVPQGVVLGTTGSSSAPDPGTPADEIFGGKVDFLGSAIYFAPSPYTATVSFTFTNLDPAKRYAFRGTAVRGNNYANRWTLATLTGVVDAVPAHVLGTGSPGSPGIITNGWAPYGDNLVAGRQAAWNSGENRCGDVIGWDDIAPEGTSFTVICSNLYVATPTVPTVAGGTTTIDIYCYAFNAFRLEEMANVARVNLVSPAPGSEFDAPADITLTAVAAAPAGVANVQFYANDALVGAVASDPYTVAWDGVTAGDYVLRAVATDGVGASVTSAVVSIKVVVPVVNTNPPVMATVNPPAGPVTALTTVTVTFSETVVGVDAGDLRVNGSPASTVEGSGAIYAFGFKQPSYGPVAITWAGGHGIVDVGKPVLAFDETAPEASWSYTLIDAEPPTIVARTPGEGATVNSLSTIQVTFSEPVTGVNASDLRVNDVPAFGLSGGGAEYTFAVNSPGPGPATVTWAVNHGISDLALSPNPFNATAPGASWTFLYDPRVALVAADALYRYAKGTNEASNPIDAWRQAGFDDSGWLSGAAPFYYDRGGGYEGNTVLDDMYAQYTTVYMRTAFEIGNPLQVSNLALRGYCDDAFVAWINGVEVARHNVAAGELAYNATTTSTAEPLPFLDFELADVQNFLVPGMNVLAIHGVNQRDTSSDFLVDLELSGLISDPATVPPFVQSIAPPAGDLFALTEITVTFTEPVTGVTAGDLRINGVAATSVSGSGASYTFGFAQPAYGTVQVTWAAAHGIADQDDPPKPFDGTAPGSTFEYHLFNPDAPVVVGQAPAGGTTIYELTQITVNWSKSVTGVNAADLLINGLPATGVSGSGASRTFSFSQPAYGPVNIGWAANHGIADLSAPPLLFDPSRPGATWQYTLVDQTPPAILTQTPPAGATVTNLTQVQVTFTEPVTGVNAADLRINGVPATGSSGSGASYTFTFPQPNATTVEITWVPTHGILDLAPVPNAFNETAPGSSWQYQTPDNVPPAVASLNPPAMATVRSLTQISVSFNEAVTGVEAGDLLINGAGALSRAGSGAGPYTFSFSEPPTGTVQVAWSAGHGIRDLSPTPNGFAGGEWTYVLDPEASFADKIVINEIMYHPATQLTTEEFIEVHNTSVEPINLAGWRFTRGVDFTFPNLSIAGGGYLVVAANLPAFQAKYPAVTAVIGNWTNMLSNGGEEIRLVTAIGEEVDRVEYADEGDWAIRQRGPLDSNHRGWEWFTAHDGVAINTATGQSEGGRSLELRNPIMPNNQGQNWAASVPPNGTPGAANSVAGTNIPPLVSEVIHFPAVPRSTDPVTITARIRDERTNGVTVQLFQRDHSTTSPGDFIAVTMRDDGASGDGAAGDRIYGVVLPAQPDETVIEFYVQATDLEGNVRTWPAAARQVDGSFAQTANALYQVDDETYAGMQPIYRLVMTETERLELQNINRSSDAEMNATFVTVEGPDTKIRYNTGVRIRGSGTRSRTPPSQRVNIPTDRRWNGASEVNLNTQYTHAQLAGNTLALKSGLPSAQARVVQVRLNSRNLANSGLPQYGSYVHLEALNGDWARAHYPHDGNGNVYRATEGWNARLEYLGGDDSAYAPYYNKSSNQSEYDYSDLARLTYALSSTTPDEAYVEAVSTNANVAMWMRYFAVCTLLEYSENGLPTGIGDDYAMYRGVEDPRMLLVPHDFDTILNQGDTGGDIGESIWLMVERNQMPVLRRFMYHNAFAPVYFQQLLDLLDTTFATDSMDAALDQMLGGWIPEATINNMQTFAAARAANVRGQIPTTFSVNVPLAVVDGYYQTTSSSVTVDGRANAVITRSLKVNGITASWTAYQGRWSATVPLRPGINHLLVQCLDAAGAEVARTNTVVWYDDGSVATVSGTLGSDTTWLAANGPYYVSGNLTVAAGATLTVEPGTTVYIGAGVSLTVNGRLRAEGTEAQRIRFTRRPGTADTWSGIRFSGTTQDNRLSYADLDYAASGDPITLVNSALLIDNVTWTGTSRTIIDLSNSSLIVRNSVFPTIVNNEAIHGVTMPANGYVIIEGNYFGGTTGYSDIIDFSGGARPGPILQVLNNVFNGGSDDALDLDGTDAHVEGNVFMNIHQDAARASGSYAIATDAGSDITVVRNLFYDIDSALLLKGGARATFDHNTVVRVRTNAPAAYPASVISFGEPDRGVAPGAGADLAGNIFWEIDQDRHFLHFNPATMYLNVSQSLLSGPVYPGPGNLNGNPLLANTEGVTWETIRDDLRLLAGSPALGAGPNGLDLGALVPAGASISGEPVSPTPLTSATLAMGGPGITHYRYRVNSSVYSPEIPITTPLALSSLNPGSYTVFVQGKNSAAVWQTDAAVSRTWTVNPGAVGLRLNEILASNDGAVAHEGTSPDCVELFNGGGTALDLAGLRLTDDPRDPDKFIFPAGTTLGAGQYLVVYANTPDVTSGHHLGFNLAAGGEGVYLYDKVSAGGALLDAVEFGLQLPDWSIGRLGDGSWGLTVPTFGAANRAAALGDSGRLKLNEWLAIGGTLFARDFVEVYNPSTASVALGGLFLTDNPVGWLDRHAIAPLSFIGPQSYQAFIADGDAGDGAAHLNFQLAGEQGMIALVDAALNVIDCVSYGPQWPDRSEGRSPNGASTIVGFNQPTPGAANPGVTSSEGQTIDLVTFDDAWRYDQSGGDLGSGWRESGFDDGAWASGNGLLGFEDSPAVAPLIQTALNPNGTNGDRVITYYFRTTFEANTNSASAEVTASTYIDDGAVIYLNGVEVNRVRIESGPVGSQTLATTAVGDATLETFAIPLEALVNGVNVLAAEVHQASASSSDLVWGMALQMQVVTNPPSPISVVFNEVLARNENTRETDDSTPDWVELYNQSGTAVDLSDTSLSDALDTPRRWVFPAGTTIPGLGYLRVRCDGGEPASTSVGPVMNSGFGLSGSGGGVFLFDRTANGGALLVAINYGHQIADFSIGRIPNGNGTWQLTLPTPDSANLGAVVGDARALRVNEWMADPDGGDDWFELFNPNAQPVALGGLHLTDDFNNRFKSPIPLLSFMGAGTNGYLKIIADSNPGAGADHADFRLSASGESLGLCTAEGVWIDTITFGSQAAGVSEGRFPDGSAALVSFPGTSSPGEANYRWLSSVAINEVLSHSDDPLEDAIELRNLTGAPVPLGGWWLSDARSRLQKFRIPDGTVLSANGYVVFYEAQFNADPMAPSSFALSSADGDEVYLSQAANGVLTGYRTSVRFGAAENGVSFGQYETSVGVEFVALSARTFGEDDPASLAEFRTGTGHPNAYPQVGPIVISEIMYHPPDIGGLDNVADEYIELHNLSTVPVPLYDPAHPTNVWRLRDAVDFEFPPNTVMAPGDYLLVVSFDPVADPAALAAFRSKYAVTSGAAIVGPYRGRLANDSEDIELKKSDEPNPEGVSYVLVDRIKYADAAPWPAAADGAGYSLHRLVAAEFGNDPVNWIAGVPTPGPQSLPLDSDGDGLPDAWEEMHFGNLDRDGTGDFDGDGMSDGDEYLANTVPTDPNSRLVATEVGFNGASFILRFTAAANTSYTIQYRDSLTAGAWSKLLDVPPQSVTGPIDVADPDAASGSMRYYRIVTPAR